MNEVRTGSGSDRVYYPETRLRADRDPVATAPGSDSTITVARYEEVTLNDNRQKLILLLRLAYSGELAAAYAYRGHWKSVRDENERTSIRGIEADEWHHRELVGKMLDSLGAAPNKWREFRATVIGRVLGVLCHVMGWLAPMYGAGRLESRNIQEYETAARYARDCDCPNLISCLLEMAEVEWDHEFYFRARVGEHFLGRRLPLWPQPPPKETIRLSFAFEAGATVDDNSRDRPGVTEPGAVATGS
jgi:demethoxyubiquinone hydroxylase (CLK1/Coq7/Cat5 family)